MGAGKQLAALADRSHVFWGADAHARARVCRGGSPQLARREAIILAYGTEISKLDDGDIVGLVIVKADDEDVLTFDVAVDKRLGRERVQVHECTAHAEDDAHPLLPAERRLVLGAEPVKERALHALEHEALVLAVSRVGVELDEVRVLDASEHVDLSKKLLSWL